VGLSSTTAAGLARWFTDAQWRAVETGIENVFRDAKCGTYRRDIRSSTRRGCGVRCSRSASRAGCTSSPPPSDRRHAGRSRRPRRPSRDRHPAPPADLPTRTPDPPRRRDQSASTTRAPPARGDPRPAPCPARNSMTRPSWPRQPRKPANPPTRGDLGPSACHQPRTTPRNDQRPNAEINLSTTRGIGSEV
jgi:hypothetical protein